jgi:hypothetical protein
MMFCLALQMNSKLRGKLGALPLPEGERVGVRGLRSIERPDPPHPPRNAVKPAQTA